MTFKGGDHIDCDMVGPKTELTSLLGNALQSALYWIAEKPSRMARTTLYVGRVGEVTARKVRRPGEMITLGQAETNFLNNENDVRVYRGRSDAAGKKGDKGAYMEALEKLEARRRRRFRGGPPPRAAETPVVDYGDITPIQRERKGEAPRQIEAVSTRDDLGYPAAPDDEEDFKDN